MTRDLPADLTRPHAIIFDWDNTLIDSWVTIHAALVETFELMGQEPWTYDETRERVRYSMRESFPKLFGDRWEEAAAQFYASFERVHIEHLTPLPGAHDMLQELHGTGTLPCRGQQQDRAVSSHGSRASDLAPVFSPGRGRGRRWKGRIT